MDVALLVAVIGAVVTAIGWLATSALTTARERRARSVQAQLAHTERQLERLYGPLMFLVIEGRQLFEDLLDSLGRRFVFPPDGRLEDDELRLWQFFLEHSALPRNDAIRQLLADNAHLIEGGSMPATFRAFVQHHASWRLAHERWSKDGVEYAFHSRVNWPSEFDQEVEEQFERLMARHAALLREAGP